MLDLPSARALEESLLDAAIRRSPDVLASLIHDDFVEFGVSGGTHDKREVLEAAGRLPDIVTPLADFEVVMLSNEVALVTYRSTTKHRDGSATDALRSSIWVHADGRWQLRLHQGTPAGTDDAHASG